MPFREDQKLRILIIDDDEDDFLLTSDYIRRIPSQELEIHWCHRYDDAYKFIAEDAYHLYLVDYLLGGNTGLELIKKCMAEGYDRPFILLTGKGNHQIDIEAMQAGAMDYLVKSELDTEKLGRAIRYAIERSKTIRALKANEKKYRNIFIWSADAVFLADKDLVFLDMNQATEVLLGLSRQVLLEKSFFEFVDEKDRERLKGELEESGSVINRELILVNGLGEKRHCIFSAGLEESLDKDYFQGIIHDITEMKKAELINLRMEKRDMADRLVQVLAHEVRNPLNNINLSVEQLAPEITNPDNKVFFDIIARNSRRIESLITELLNSSRPAQILESPVLLREIIDETLAAANDRITLKKINLEKVVPDEEMWVMADKEKFKIALLNIIINALEAMNPGEGILQVIVQRDKDQALLTIRDNGCGIPEENLRRLFEPYFTAKRNGMGLGLATTLNLLQSHRAGVEVDSKEGEGTVFRISIPLISDNLLNTKAGSE